MFLMLLSGVRFANTGGGGLNLGASVVLLSTGCSSLDANEDEGMGLTGFGISGALITGAGAGAVTTGSGLAWTLPGSSQTSASDELPDW